MNFGEMITEQQHKDAIAAAASPAAIAKKRDADIKANGGVRMSDGHYYPMDQVMTNDQGEYVLKDKPGVKATNADGTPYRPQNIQVVDQNGNLKQGQAVEYQQVDPSKLEGYNMLKNMAESQGPTSLAQAQTEQAGLQKNQATDVAVQNAAGAAAQARAGAEMRGGLSSGGRTSLARQNMKDILAAKQGVQSNYLTNVAGINAQDADRKMNLVKDFGNAEGQLTAANADTYNKQLDTNKQLQGAGIQNANQYRMDAYTADLDKWGAATQASATRNSGGGGGGGGCCFIFMEARYGSGAMDLVVRKYRDEHLTPKNQRGYYKLSQVLVPLMRKSKLIKFIVRVMMTDPLVAYGKAHYGYGPRIGLLFKPVKDFWLKTFDYLGEDHEFKRENGEVV